MVDRKKTPRTKGKVTTEMYDAPKNCSAPEKGPTVGKEKTVVGVKRHELGIYETERSILDKI
jgi:hypothetical protein